MYHWFNTSDSTKIFSGNPEDKSSNFYSHKLEVIKNSIKYNLNLSISNYANKMNSTYQFSLPVITDEEWDKILNDISIVSFMQGWDCGLDIYNNYQVVSSTNNELTVTPEEIYYVEKDNFNNEAAYYHRIDCPSWDIPDKEAGSSEYYPIVSFKSKDIKYDKENNLYDHKNLACYTCINTGNYTQNSLFGTLFVNDPDYYKKTSNLKNTSKGGSNAKKLAAYIGIAQARQSTYKTNAFTVSQGYKVYNYGTKVEAGSYNVTDIKESLNDIVKLYITISETKKVSGITDTMFSFNIKMGTCNGSVALPFQDKSRTIELDLSQTFGGEGNTITFSKSAACASFKLESIKVLYK